MQLIDVKLEDSDCVALECNGMEPSKEAKRCKATQVGKIALALALTLALIVALYMIHHTSYVPCSRHGPIEGSPNMTALTLLEWSQYVLFNFMRLGLCDRI